jgi:hypothetical protein
LNTLPTGIKLPALTTKAVRKTSTGEVFLLEAGKRRHIPDPETQQALAIADTQIHELKDDETDAIPLGTPMEHGRGPQAK